MKEKEGKGGGGGKYVGRVSWVLNSLAETRGVCGTDGQRLLAKFGLV